MGAASRKTRVVIAPYQVIRRQGSTLPMPRSKTESGFASLMYTNEFVPRKRLAESAINFNSAKSLQHTQSTSILPRAKAAARSDRSRKRSRLDAYHDHRVPSHHHRGLRARGLWRFIRGWGVAPITCPHGIKCCPARCWRHRRSDARPSRDQSSPAGGTRPHQWSLRRPVLPRRSGWRGDGRHRLGIGRMAD